ncbi:hypothetical protein TWF694_001109 [Orbilia ellipsospora]|uniref:Ankyrin n=1 Tax=Orbilia ellipsospora TaxID=2528407 RepID=A0AAV9XR26_9PEZI
MTMRAVVVRPRTALLLPCRPTQWRCLSFGWRPRAPKWAQHSLISKCNVETQFGVGTPQARVPGLRRGFEYSFPSRTASTATREERLKTQVQNELRTANFNNIHQDIISKITDQPRDKLISEKILITLSTARRPLRRAELETILSLIIEATTINELQSSIDKNVSRGFIVNKENRNLQIKDEACNFLFSGGREMLGWSASDDREIARLLINYLCDKNLVKLGPCKTAEEWRQREKDYPLLLYAASSWIYHLTKADGQAPVLVNKASQLWTTGLDSTYGVWLQAAFMDKQTARGEPIESSVLDMHNYRTEVEDSTLKSFSENGSEILTSWLQWTRTGDSSELRIFNQKYSPGAELLTQFGLEFLDVLRTRNFSAGFDIFKFRSMFRAHDIRDVMNRVDDAGETLLHSVVKYGDLALLGQVLEQEPDVNVYGAIGYTPLHYAAQRLSAAFVKALLAAGADPNGSLPYMPTPLHCACESKPGKNEMKKIAQQQEALDIVKILIEAGAKPAAVDGDGVTPLAFAAMNDHDEIVTYLSKLYSTDEINAVGWWGTTEPLTALTAAIIYGARKSIVRGLINKGGTGPPGASKLPIPQIFESSCSISPEVFKLLRQSFPDSMMDSSGQSLISRLFEHCGRPQLMILKSLLNSERERNSVFENYEPYKESTLQGVALSGLVGVILDFAKAEKTKEIGEKLPWKDIWKDICRQDVEKAEIKRFLHQRPEFDTTEYLTDALFESLACKSSEETALFYLQRLKPKFEDKTCLPPWKLKDEKTGDTILHLVCENNLDKVYMQLENNYSKAIKDNVNAQNMKGETPLMKCFGYDPVKNMRSGLICRLLENRMDLTIRDNRGQTALYHVIDSEEWEDTNEDVTAVEMLLKKDQTKKTLEIPDNLGLLPIDLACLNNDIEVVRKLEEYGAKLRLTDDKGFDIFPRMRLKPSRAVAADPLILEMIKMGADINYVNSRGQTLLFKALRAGSASLVRMLLVEYKVDPTQPLRGIYDYLPEETYTALPFLNGCQYYPRMTMVLLRYATPKQRRALINGRSQDGKGETPLHFFMRKSTEVGVIRALIEAGADVNAVDANGNTPLWYANRRGSGLTFVEGGEVESVTPAYYLLKAGADPNYRNPITGETILEHIVHEQRFDLKISAIDLLIQHGGLDRNVDPAWIHTNADPKYPPDYLYSRVYGEIARLLAKAKQEGK